MSRNGRYPEAHNRKPQKHSMKVIKMRRRRRRSEAFLRLDLKRPWEGNE